MELRIEHYTKYHYPEPVFLEPQYLNFYPQQRSHIRVKNFELEIRPKPEGCFSVLNVENNIQHQLWFNHLISDLEIEVNIDVISNAFNPFDFFIDLGQINSNKASISPYLLIEDKLPEEVLELMVQYKEWKIQDYLRPVNEMLGYVYNNWGHESRYEENILSPAECFVKKNGSCRDLSWMMINMLRYIEIPARFVSGYAYNPELGEGHELHAWVEFFIPGAGWIGVDPSAGMFVNEAYIPTATSYNPKATLPVSGTYRGNVPSELKTEVKIIKLDK